VLRLHLPEEDAHLRNDSLVRQLAAAASQRLGSDVVLRFEGKPAATGDTLHARTQRERSEKQSAAEASFLSDPVVAQLLGQGGSIVPDSIRPLSEN
jgi:DNA polymerase-3 subunit gamma/tau